jgi:hypothetical protein
MLTEAREPQLRATQLQNAFDRLTPELSRAERGRGEPVLRARRQVSTKPRDGVGLNDWLGAKDAGESEAMTNRPKTEAPDARARAAKYPPAVTEATVSGAKVTAVSRPVFPKSMAVTQVMLERA